MSIKVVSERSEREIQATHAEIMVRDALRELAANLIRIARGAGKPHEIEVQAGRLLDACEEYRAAAGHGLPVEAVQAMLRVRKDPPEEGRWTEMQDGIEDVLAGALQMAASRLMGQSTHEIRGRHEPIEGVTQIERFREESRRQWLRPQGSHKGRGRGKGSALDP